MDKFSIKKLFLGLCIFIILAVSITALLIFLKLHSTSDDLKTLKDNIVQEVTGTKKNQKYNQNDLNIIQETVNYEGLEYKTLRISGLKNKEIESNVNAEIEGVENDFRERVVNASGEASSMYLTSYVNANYSNILSVSFYGSKNNSNYRNEINIHKFLNFDLTTGNQIKLEDLFVPNTDVDLIAQDYIYKEKLHEKFSQKDIFFNSEYWEDGKLNYLINEIDELDFMNEFLKYKNSNKDFYITPTDIEIRYSDDYNTGIVHLNFKDNLDKLVAYDKFVTEESIFESDDIGLKNLYVCSDVALYADESYYVIEDVAPNFRIDARVNIFCYSAFEGNEVYENAVESVKKEINEKKEALAQKAKENSEKYYLLDLVYIVDSFDPAYYSSLYYDYIEPSYDKLIISKQEHEYETTMDDFSEWFEDKMISAYTSENYTIDYQMYIRLSDEESEKCQCTEDYTGIVYMLNTGEATSNIEEIFVEGTDYVSTIADYMERYNNVSREKMEEILENHEYHFEMYSIVFDGLDTSMSWNNFKRSDFK